MPVYISTVRDFVREHIAERLADARRSRGMYDALERHPEWDEDTDLSMGASGNVLTYAWWSLGAYSVYVFRFPSSFC